MGCPMTQKTYLRCKESDIKWIGKVPEHWEVKKLKYCLLLATRKIESRKPQVALENIESWTGRFIKTETEFEGDGIAFEEGDILFGKLRPYLAKVFLAQFSGEAVGDFFVMHPSPTIDGRFAQYQILNKDFIAIIDSATYGAKMPRVDWEFMGNMEITLPPLPEQISISSFLNRETSRIDTLISEKEQLISLLQEYRQALISHAVTKGLDPKVKMKDSGVEWLGEIPEHWEVKRLKFLGQAIIGLTYDPSEIVDEGDGILVLRSSNVQGGQIVFDDNVFVRKAVPEKILTKLGDILICSRNGSRALIGKNAVIDDDSVGLTFGAFMTIFRSKHNLYLSYVFNSSLFEFQSGSFLTSTVNQLTTSNLYSFEVPVPPNDEQFAIASFLGQETSRIDTLISEARKFIDLLKEYRSSLISAAVTGKIDVREAVSSVPMETGDRP